jgi:hypothetical protein
VEKTYRAMITAFIELEMKVHNASNSVTAIPPRERWPGIPCRRRR